MTDLFQKALRTLDNKMEPPQPIKELPYAYNGRLLVELLTDLTSKTIALPDDILNRAIGASKKGKVIRLSDAAFETDKFYQVYGRSHLSVDTMMICATNIIVQKMKQGDKLGKNPLETLCTELQQIANKFVPQTR